MEAGDPTRELQALIDDVERELRSGRLTEARTLAGRAVRFSRERFGEADVNTASAWSTLGICLAHQGEDEGARKVLEKALAILRPRVDGAAQRASVENNLSAVCRKLKLPRQALAHALASVERRLALRGLAHPETATSIATLGHALSCLGWVVPALECYDIAAPHDTATGKAASNHRTLTQAIESDPRFGILPSECFDDDVAGLDLERIVSACRGVLQDDMDDGSFLLRFGQPSHAESYAMFVGQLKIALQGRPRGEMPAAAADDLIDGGRARLYRHTGIPLHGGELLLKQIDRARLGPLGSATLAHAFPGFGAEHEARKRARGIARQFKTFNDIKRENLAARFGEDKVELRYSERQYRRYAGENNLPSGCYFSLCRSPDGDDGQTLCRELYEYTDPEIPGFVWVGDSCDAELMAALACAQPAGPTQLAPGIYVFLVPPPEQEMRPLYREFYAPILEQTGNWDGICVVHVPTQLRVETFDRIFDLRQQASQDWFHAFFAQGDGGVFLKECERAPGGFTDMLPALVHPEFGGSGVTKGVGSWMRLMGVDALIYPSARSDAHVRYDEAGALSGFHGWNLVDYRGARFVPDREVHLDLDDWYGFQAGRQEAPTLRREGRSWAIEGSEKRYRWERGAFIELLRRSS